jgi:hypothetical protein
MTHHYCLIRRAIASPTGALARAARQGNALPRTTDRTLGTRWLAPAVKSAALLLLAPRPWVYNPSQGKRTQIQTA